MSAVQKLVGTALLLLVAAGAFADDVLQGPYNPYPQGTDAYTADTGGSVYSPSNGSGECVWFVRAVRPDPLPSTLPSGTAKDMYPNAVSAHWHVGSTPKPGAIMCFNGTVGAGSGHVAVVTQVISSSEVIVWDSNFALPEDHMVRKRRVTNFGGLQGYIYAQNSDTPPILQAPSAILENLPVEGYWYTTNEHINWRITGGANPITIYEVINGSDVASYVRNVGDAGYVNLAVGGTGYKICKVRVQNASGSSESTTWTGGFDANPPTAILTGGPGPNTWLRGSISVFYTGADVGAGFKDSRWWIEGGATGDWATTNPRPVTLPSVDGKYRLHVEVADDAWTGTSHVGNSSGDIYLGEFWIDDTAPLVSFGTIEPPSPADAAQVSITVNAIDPGGANASGIQSTVLTVDGQTLTGSNGVFTWDASVAAPGTHTLVATVADWAGNSTTSSTTYNIDRTAPTATLALSPANPNGAHGYYTVQPVATITAQSTVGTAVAHYRINGGSDTTYSGSFPITQRGAVTIDYWAVSSFGRIGQVQSQTLYVDTTPPGGFTLEDEGVQTPSWSSLNVSLHGVIDGESAPRTITYTVGNAPGDDSYRHASTVYMNGPWLAVEGLALPVGAKVYVTLQVTNDAGLTSSWYSTDGITINPSGWNYAVWTDVLGGAGDFSSDVGYLIEGTLGEALVDKSITDNSDGAVESGFWALVSNSVAASQLNLNVGKFYSGSVNDTWATDQSYYSSGIGSPIRARGPFYQLDLIGQSTLRSASALHFHLRASETGGAHAAKVLLFNNVSQSWDVIGTIQLTAEDTTYDVAANVSPANFVNSTNGTVKARIQIDGFSIQTGPPPESGPMKRVVNTIRIDLARWQIVP